MTYKGVTVAAALALAPLGLALSACSAGTSSTEQTGQKTAETVAVTIITAQGQHKFQVERARTAAEQEQGLMYRTDLKPDGGMLFWPYPPEGGGPRQASFWMKNTPTPLDILFIRADGTIATIAENAVPFSETPVLSREPVAAVLELVGGRAAALGIAEGDTATWQQTQ